MGWRGASTGERGEQWEGEHASVQTQDAGLHVKFWSKCLREHGDLLKSSEFATLFQICSEFANSDVWPLARE